MSLIGKNIKKIRSIKKLNQSQFADLFDLSRASIGSYEEGRAEPKIDKIIEIANYFSIKTDLLLKKELSVNEISGFNLVDSKMLTGNENNLIKNTFKSIIYIKPKSEQKFITHIKNNNKWAGDEIALPPTIKKETTIAFSHNDNAMDLNNNGISMLDIVFGEKIDVEEIFDGYIYLIVLKNTMLLRKVYLKEDTLLLKAVNVNFQPKTINKENVVAFYKINAVVKNSINHFID